MNRRGAQKFVALIATLLVALTLGACGDDEKKSNAGEPTGAFDTTERMGPIPTGVTGPTKGPKITHTPQAGKYKDVERDVVEALDRLAEAVNKDDAVYLCRDGFSAADVKALDKQGRCTEAIKRLFAVYGGYKISVKDVEVTGDNAIVKALLTANENGKKAEVGNKFKLRLEDGKWKVYIGADKLSATDETGDSQ